MDHDTVGARRGVPRESAIVVSGFSHGGKLPVTNIGIGGPVQVISHERRAIAAKSLVRLPALEHDRIPKVTEIAAGGRKPQQKPAKRIELLETAIGAVKPRNLAIKE